MSEYKIGDERTILWSAMDTPIPKVGEQITSIFKVVWKVTARKKQNDGYWSITMRRVE